MTNCTIKESEIEIDEGNLGNTYGGLVIKRDADNGTWWRIEGAHK